MPHDHKHVLGRYHKGGEKEVKAAIKAAQKAKKDWAATPFEHRAAILLKAADLLAGRCRHDPERRHHAGPEQERLPGRDRRGLRADRLLALQPLLRPAGHEPSSPSSAPGMWNQLEQRPLDGFVFAVTPFNFTSIAGNLPTAPGADGQHRGVEAGLEFGLQRLVHHGDPQGSGHARRRDQLRARQRRRRSATRSWPAPSSPASTSPAPPAVFQGMWKQIGDNIHNYGCYPRIVGETGGKDFVFAHPSADVDALVTALVRGAFEYQGQKCSAASRAYIPANLWEDVQEELLAEVGTITMGDVTDFRTFMGAVIDQARLRYHQRLHRPGEARPAARRRSSPAAAATTAKGYFIEPTVIEATDPHFETMVEEIFGPVLTVYVYQEKDLLKTLRLCDKSSAYALTGAIFAQDRAALIKMKDELEGTAGNFYINDKPTGAVVGQQPFGGGRASGTNDKAGSYLNLIRWISPRTVKETFDPPRAYPYPYMSAR